MKLVESILTNNPCYKTGDTIEVKGLMLHSVGCSQPNASVFIRKWNKDTYNRACVHGFIDANDGTVYQTLPWNHRGWHGGGTSNDTHIGVEMCEPASIKYTAGSTFTCLDKDDAIACAERTYKAAVELFAMLCEKFNLDPLAKGVIVSHKEGCALGIASNHADPDHLWKQLKMGYTMDTFRQAVKEAMKSNEVVEEPKKEEPVKEAAPVEEPKKEVPKKSIDEVVKEVIRGEWGHNPHRKKALIEAGYDYQVIQQKVNEYFAPKKTPVEEPKKEETPKFEPYKVKVDITNLNIRKGPGTNYSRTGKFTGIGVFTIVEEKEGTGANKGWGKLKSGAGWISLDFARKL